PDQTTPSARFRGGFAAFALSRSHPSSAEEGSVRSTNSCRPSMTALDVAVQDRAQSCLMAAPYRSCIRSAHEPRLQREEDISISNRDSTCWIHHACTLF